MNTDGTGVYGSQFFGNSQNGMNGQVSQSTSYGKNGGKASVYNTAAFQSGYGKPQYQGSSMITRDNNGTMAMKNDEQGVNATGSQMFNQYYGNQFNKANDEVMAYRGGGYQYQKGKGWQMNESINRKIDNIVSECIRNCIR